MSLDTSKLIRGSGVVGLFGIALLVVRMVGDPAPRYREVQGMSAPPSWALPVCIAGFVITGLAGGVMALAFALERRRPSRGKADLRPEVEFHDLPFSVCTECRILIDLPHAFCCPRCDSLSTTVRVETAADRSLAIAALGPPP